MIPIPIMAKKMFKCWKLFEMKYRLLHVKWNGFCFIVVMLFHNESMVYLQENRVRLPACFVRMHNVITTQEGSPYMHYTMGVPMESVSSRKFRPTKVEVYTYFWHLPYKRVLFLVKNRLTKASFSVCFTNLKHKICLKKVGGGVLKTKMAHRYTKNQGKTPSTPRIT